MKQSPIPIVVLTHSNPDLSSVLHALYSNTNFPHEVYIVNNNSSFNSIHRHRVTELRKYYSFQLVNASNRWVLSLNHSIIQNCFDSSSYFVVLDDDCIVPPPYQGRCWLETLYVLMSKYSFIGKLALPLHEISTAANGFRSYDYIISNRSVLIDKIYECRVDTTLALYRSNLFMPESNKFSPKHMSLVRPSLYQGVFCDRHFLTTSLSNSDPYSFSPQYIRSKCLCFALNSAWLSPDNLAKTPLLYKLVYFTIRPLSSAFWSLNAIFRTLVYMSYFLQRKY